MAEPKVWRSQTLGHRDRPRPKAEPSVYPEAGPTVPRSEVTFGRTRLAGRPVRPNVVLTSLEAIPNGLPKAVGHLEMAAQRKSPKNEDFDVLFSKKKAK